MTKFYKNGNSTVAVGDTWAVYCHENTARKLLPEDRDTLLITLGQDGFEQIAETPELNEVVEEALAWLCEAERDESCYGADDRDWNERND